jgi:hypothetical protein
MENTNELVLLSGKLLHKVKLNESIQEEEQKLRSISTMVLHHYLNTDEAKKTFWINCYNAYFQILSSREKLNRKTIFTKKSIIIAQTRFNLDDIEHGILRKYRWKWSFGYLPNPFISLLIRNLAVKKIDYRIHFVLNCGAKSCPPIAFYKHESIDSQLNNAMHSFVESETTIDSVNKTVTTSKLLHWYRGDFGGTSGIKKILKQVLNIELDSYTLNYSAYNWETQLENFTEI